jgi:hypothetical protein
MKVSKLSLVVLLVAAVLSQAAFVSSDSLYVTRLGDGSGALSNSANVYIDQYSFAGTKIGSVAVSSAGTNTLTMAVSGSHEGHLNVSSNGQYLTVAGYNVTAGASVANGTACVVGRIGIADSSVDTSTAITDGLVGMPVRGAATDDGSRFWIVGDNTLLSSNTKSNTGGTRYATLGATTSTSLSQNTVGKDFDNIRGIQILNGQLYSSSGSSSSVGKAVFQVGSGLPTSGAQTLTKLTTDGVSVTNFSILDLNGDGSADTMYTVGDDVRKFWFNGTSWVSKGIVTGVASPDDICAQVINGQVNVFVTNAIGVYKLTDTSIFGQTISGSFSSFITAGTNEQFRGVAAVPEPATMGLLLLGAAILGNRRK